MFTQSCCDVKIASLAAQHETESTYVPAETLRGRALGEVARRIPMLDSTPALAPPLARRPQRKRARRARLARRRRFGLQHPRLGHGSTLAASVDASPAVLVSIYDYAHRYRDKGRRTA